MRLMWTGAVLLFEYTIGSQPRASEVKNQERSNKEQN